MNKIAIVSTAILMCFTSAAINAQHAYINFDAEKNMVVSGPFDVIIPRPGDARVGGPEHSNENFLDEKLNISKAGYFADDQFVMVQIETTNAPAGTLSNENLPVHELAGQEFRARTLCVDISQEELDADDNALFEFIEGQNVQIVPGVQAIQLFATAEDGTGEGIILYMRNVPGGCSAMTPEFEAEFKSDFEGFIASIQSAN